MARDGSVVQSGCGPAPGTRRLPTRWLTGSSAAPASRCQYHLPRRGRPCRRTAPELGRSALDAVELMNVGVQFLREHMPRRRPDPLRHSGRRRHQPQRGAAPGQCAVHGPGSNVVTGRMELLHQRVDKIAQGAALMTGHHDRAGDSSTACPTPCPTTRWKSVLYDEFRGAGRAGVYGRRSTPSRRSCPRTYRRQRHPRRRRRGEAIPPSPRRCKRSAERPLDQRLPDAPVPQGRPPSAPAPPTWATSATSAPRPRSTWRCGPTTCPATAGRMVSCSKTPLAHRATVHAGKVLCAAAIDLIEQLGSCWSRPRRSSRKRTAGGYTCPIPADAVPAPLD